MTSTTILTILLVSSFIVGRFLRRFQAPNFVFSGMIYVIFGLLLGPHLGIDILNAELVKKLEPLTGLLIGIAGCLLGLRVKSLFKNTKILITGLISATIVFSIVVLCFFFISPLLLPDDPSLIQFININLFGFHFQPELQINQLWFCLGIGATACSASLLNLGTTNRAQKGSSEISRVLSLLTPSVQSLSILLFGICLASSQAGAFANQLDISLTEWLIASLLSGVLCGGLFSLFIGTQSNEDRILLAALGAIIFACGVGTLLGISSLFVAFITGATISLFSSYQNILKESLIRLEEPIFVLLLVISGATWHPELSLVWVLPILYFILRFVIFSIFPQRIYRFVTDKKLTRLGQGLLGQDLMAVAVALSFATVFPEVSQMFLTTILGSIFLNDILANSLLQKVILDNEQKTTIEVIHAEEGAT